MRINTQRYSEAINMLYSHTDFYIGGLEDTTRLARSIPAQRLDAIYSIHLNVWYQPFQYGSVSESGPTWEACCRTIAGMRGLRELRVHINFALPVNVSCPSLSQILHPLRAVTGARIFEVYVPGSGEEKARAFLDAPFVFKSAPSGTYD